MSDVAELWVIPSHWDWKLIKDLGSIVSGGTPSTKEPSYWGGNINWISPADLTGYSKKTISKGAKSITEKGLKNSSAKIMPAGSVHFSSRAPIGYVVISASDISTNQGFKSLVPADGVFNEYVYYYLKSSKQLAESRASGTTFLELSGRAFGDLPIPMPSEREQKSIVAKIEELFSELDSGIDSLKTAQEQLKIYRQALLKHAFEGKLTEQWRKDNASKLESPEQLLARIQQEREIRHQQQLEEWKQEVEAWEESGKEGRRPRRPTKVAKVLVEKNSEGAEHLPWVYVNYESVCELIRNGVSAKPVGEVGTKIFRISAVRAMKFDLSDVRYIDNTDGQYDDFFLKKGDLVFTRYNGTREYVGVCAEYKGDETHLYPDKLILTRLGVESLLPSFLEKAFAAGISRGFIEQKIRTTAGQSGVSGGDIKNTPIPVCSLPEQQEIVNQLEEKLSIIEQNEKEIENALAKAELLRQSILKKAFSGRLIYKESNS